MRAHKVLNEKLIEDINSDEILTNDFIKELFNNDYNLRSYVLQYIYEEGYTLDIDYSDIDPNADDEIIEELSETSEFKEWFKYELEVRIENLKELFEELIDYDGTITLWREMRVSDDYIDKLLSGQIKRIGEYWTYDEDAAESHWGNFNLKNKILFETNIKENYINWEDTFILNLDESLKEEKEVRLFKNTPIKLSNIKFNDVYIDEEILNKIKLLHFKS